MEGLEGKTVIVTGGGGAIGRAICLRLAREGCIVGVFDIRGDEAEETVRQVGEAGGAAHASTTDITDLDAVKAGVAGFEAAAGPTDILVNNAGYSKFVTFLETGPELWHQMISINLMGPIHMTHTVLTGMAERRAGVILSIASDAGRVGSSGESVYSACKGGIIALTKTLAREHARDGIRVNAVCPGPTDTPLFQSYKDAGEYGRRVFDSISRAFPMRRIGQPEDLPGAVAFLISDDAAFITGQILSVSGGLTMHD